MYVYIYIYIYIYIYTHVYSWPLESERSAGDPPNGVAPPDTSGPSTLPRAFRSSVSGVKSMVHPMSGTLSIQRRSEMTNSNKRLSPYDLSFAASTFVFLLI